MARFRLTLEYDGAAFVGWQRQANGFSVQEALESALFKLTRERANITGAGRTDAGVHALGQVAHVDLARKIDTNTLREGLNAHLRPHPISVLAARAVGDDFHARFSATRRAYLYRILNRRPPPVLQRGRVWHIARALDAPAMDRAAQALVGTHDFSTFRDSQCQAKSPRKTLERIVVDRRDAEVRVVCEAPSFLHRQVRSIVGTLVEVGFGKMKAQDVAHALAARDRTRCGPVAPAHGLYLHRIEYAAANAPPR